MTDGPMNRWTNRQTDRQTGSQRMIKKNGMTETYMDIKIGVQMYTYIYGLTGGIDKGTESQLNKHTIGWMEGQTNRQVDVRTDCILSDR
jgi:hypothetical protein